MNPLSTALVVVDVQGRLASLMPEHEKLFHNIGRSIHIAEILGLPILWTEQAPEKIGATVGPISQLLFPLIKPISKRTFSCFGCEPFRDALAATGRRHVLVTGIETHVCIYQTARDLVKHGYEVSVASDAVASKSVQEKQIAIDRMRHEGVIITTSEMAAADMLGGADHPKFRQVMAHIKR